MLIHFIELAFHFISLLGAKNTVKILVGIVPQEKLREFCSSEQGPSTGIAPPNGILFLAKVVYLMCLVKRLHRELLFCYFLLSKM